MNKIVEEVKKNGVFFIATIDGEQSRVRPFSAIEDIDGKICFCTGNTKDVYKQMMAHPCVELSSMSKDGSWIRVNGKLVRHDDKDLRTKFLEAMPSLKAMYSPDDGKFEVLELCDAKATRYFMNKEPEVIA